MENGKWKMRNSNSNRLKYEQITSHSIGEQCDTSVKY